MYLEQLTTPNCIRFPNTTSQPITETYNFPAARAHLDEANHNWHETIETVGRIQDIVRQSLHYPDDPREYAAWELDTARTALEKMSSPEQSTTCRGYAVLGSEALSAAGISHYVAYGRKHWFTIIPNHDSPQPELYMQDFLLPEFNTNITGHLSGSLRPAQASDSTPAERLVSALGESPHRLQNIVLDTRVIAAKLGLAARELANKYPVFWGSPKRKSHSPTPDERTLYSADKRAYRQLQWVLSVYTPEAGRNAIAKYDTFITALKASEFALAGATIQTTGDQHPEKDCRYGHTEIRQLIAGMCAIGLKTGTIRDTLEAYCSGIPNSDPRTHELRGNLYRIVAKQLRDGDAASLAVHAYDTAARLTKLRSKTYIEACYGRAATVRPLTEARV